MRIDRNNNSESALPLVDGTIGERSASGNRDRIGIFGCACTDLWFRCLNCRSRNFRPLDVGCRFCEQV